MTEEIFHVSITREENLFIDLLRDLDPDQRRTIKYELIARAVEHTEPLRTGGKRPEAAKAGLCYAVKQRGWQVLPGGQGGE